MNASESKRTMRSFIWRFSIEDSFQTGRSQTGKIVFSRQRSQPFLSSAMQCAKGMAWRSTGNTIFVEVWTH